MNKEVLILLPNTIPILRDSNDSQLKKNIQEFNIYFKNIIHPFKEEYDVRTYCDYGMNLGNCWRLSNFPHDTDAFDFEIVIWNEYGEKVASKKSRIELYDRSETDEEHSILFFGDSMTYDNGYIQRIAANLCNLNFLGSRNFFGNIAFDARGGWSFTDYFEVNKERFGVSPFLFPKGVDDYLGDADFLTKSQSKHNLDYTFAGYEHHKFIEGGLYGKGGNVYTYKNGEFELYLQDPEWELNFEKYVKRHQLEKLNTVSILMGANDIKGDYDTFGEFVDKYISNLERFIASIHGYNKSISVIINLPIISADQYSWGVQTGNAHTRKLYDFRIKCAAKRILEKWDNKENENVFIGPMLLCIDPENGFPKNGYKSNMHSENVEIHHSNWVHPNTSGYYQMGDAICGLIQKIRKNGK